MDTHLNKPLTAERLYGTFVALATPFCKDRDVIDYKAIERLSAYLEKSSIEGVVVAGTTGEVSSLRDEEYEKLLASARSYFSCPLIAGTGTNNIEEAIKRAHIAERHYIDALMPVVPYYAKSNDEGLYHYFEQLHNHTNLPLILYNVPSRTVNDLKPAVVVKLANNLERVISIKDASGEPRRVSEHRKGGLSPKDFSQLSGDDFTLLAHYAHGGVGTISVIAHVIPQRWSEINNACAKGDFEKARPLFEGALPLLTTLFSEPSPAPLKYALSLLGLCHPSLRPPLAPCHPSTQERIKKNLNALGML